MKIAHVVATFPPDIGGMGQVAYDEARELAKRGHDVTVFALSYPLSRYNDAGLPFRIIRSRPLIPGGIAGWVPAWRKKLTGFDLIHLHYPFYGGAESAWMNAGSVPYVATYHMDAQPTIIFKRLIKLLYDRFLAPRILGKARKVILVDDNHYFSLEKKLYPAQKTILSNGIDTEQFKPGAPVPYEFGLDNLAGKRIFLFVGNLLPVKGLSLLIKAWNKLSNDSAHLLIVGGGYHESSYKKLAKKYGVADRIHWQGPCYNKDRLVKYYRTAEAVIVPSYSESFSLVAGEALASARPVIASNVPGMGARVRENETGFLFDAGDERSLLDALEKFLNLTPDQREMFGRNGRELIEKKFSLTKHVDALENIYREAV